MCLIMTRIYVGFRFIHITSSVPTVYSSYKFPELPWQHLRHSFNNMCNIQLHLTLILLTWRIWWAPSNASKRQMGFNSACKGLMPLHIYLSHFMISCNLYFVHMCCKFKNLKLMICNCNVTYYFLSSAAWWWLFDCSRNM